MARRLSGFVAALASRRHVGRFVAVLLGVIVIHGCVTRELAERMAAFATTARMPPRIEVAYVRTLEPEAPPVLAPQQPAPQPRRRVVRPRPGKAASAPDAPASAPASPPVVEAAVADAIQALAAAASAANAAEATAADAALAAVANAAAAPGEAASRAAAPTAADATETAAARAAPASGAASREPFDWSASTRVSFVLTGNFRGEVTGNAQVEWIRVGTRYQVNLDLLVGPEFAPLITRRMSSEGELTTDGLTPSRYDEDTQVVFRERRRVSVVFEPDAVVLANGQRRERWRGVQDTASQFVQLTWLFTTHPELLRVGGTVEVPLALPRNVDRWTYDVLEEVELATPFGPLATFHLKPRRATQKNGDLSAEIWFAPSLRYLPVRIRIEQDAQTFLDLMISKKPELASR
ncbi:MAG: DUF3108 domain-containing protein [Caldimonas sp.]